MAGAEPGEEGPDVTARGGRTDGQTDGGRAVVQE